MESFLDLVHRDGRSMEEEMSRRDEKLPYDLRCEEYKVFRHQSRNNLYKFLEEQQQEAWPVNERTLPAELPKYVWNGEAIAEHN